MRGQLSIWNPAGTTLLLDCSEITTSCVARDGEHGNESLEAEIDVPFHIVFNFFQQLGALQVRANWGGYGIFRGRLEDPTQIIETDVSLKIVALGYWSAFSDTFYTAMWSITDLSLFRTISKLELFNRRPERYEIKISDRILIVPRKNEQFGGGASDLKIGSVVYNIPDDSTKEIIGISFDYQFIAPTNWIFQCNAATFDYATLTNVLSVNATGALITASVNATFTARNRIVFDLLYNSGVATTYTGETGDGAYVDISNVRVVTSTTNRINTTLTANRAAGSNVTATVGSTARMYIGQKLQINAGTATSETVTVLSIGSATQFNATFVNAYTTGQAVQAHVVYPDEIIKDCITTVNTLNPTQIIADTSGVGSQAIDLDNAVFEDVTCADVINDVIKRGDAATTPKVWIAQVFDDQKLLVKQLGTGRAWVTDIEDLQVVRSLTQLFNSIYAIYKTADNRKMRSPVSANAPSVTKFGITRRKGVQVDTTSETIATQYRDVYLAAYQDPIPRASVKITFIEDNAGLNYKLFAVRSNDQITFRNLPAILGIVYDKIRTLVIKRRTYDLIKDEITVDLESNLPSIDQQLARVLKR